MQSFNQSRQGRSLAEPNGHERPQTTNSRVGRAATKRDQRPQRLGQECIHRVRCENKTTGIPKDHRQREVGGGPILASCIIAPWSPKVNKKGDQQGTKKGPGLPMEAKWNDENSKKRPGTQPMIIGRLLVTSCPIKSSKLDSKNQQRTPKGHKKKPQRCPNRLFLLTFQNGLKTEVFQSQE